MSQIDSRLVLLQQTRAALDEGIVRLFRRGEITVTEHDAARNIIAVFFDLNYPMDIESLDCLFRLAQIWRGGRLPPARDADLNRQHRQGL